MSGSDVDISRDACSSSGAGVMTVTAEALPMRREQ
jgi:hypothetical protein